MTDSRHGTVMLGADVTLLFRMRDPRSLLVLGACRHVPILVKTSASPSIGYQPEDGDVRLHREQGRPPSQRCFCSR
jgi:hypothetical protein